MSTNLAMLASSFSCTYWYSIELCQIYLIIGWQSIITFPVTVLLAVTWLLSNYTLPHNTQYVDNTQNVWAFGCNISNILRHPTIQMGLARLMLCGVAMAENWTVQSSVQRPVQSRVHVFLLNMPRTQNMLALIIHELFSELLETKDMIWCPPFSIRYVYKQSLEAHVHDPLTSNPIMLFITRVQAMKCCNNYV